MREAGVVSYVAMILVIIGGINYGLVGFFDYDLLEAIFGTGAVMRIIYAFIGIAAVWAAFCFAKCCSKGGCEMHEHEHHHGKGKK